MRLRRLLPALGLFVLPACTPVDVGFGDAQRWDMAQQTANPEPAPPAEGAPMEGGNGVKGDSAVGNYEKGTVKQPTPLSGGGATTQGPQ